MAQSLAKIFVHLVFSTKQRKRFLTPAVRGELHAYLIGILRNWESPALGVNSLEDHVHVLFSLSKNYAVKKIVEELKKASSKWIKTKGPSFGAFQWQNGYGAFSVSQSGLSAVKTYVANQEEHHRTMTFQEEFRRFLERYQVKYDERYVWD